MFLQLKVQDELLKIVVNQFALVFHHDHHHDFFTGQLGQLGWVHHLGKLSNLLL